MHHMSALSRRSLVTSAAALPALAVPAVAVAAASTASVGHPDAELIKLGEAYERLALIRAPLVEEYNDKWGEGIAAAKEFSEIHGQEFSEECSRMWIESGAAKANDALKPVDEEMEALAIKILTFPAYTIAGLRAKATLVVDVYSGLWGEPFEDLDWDKKNLRVLIEAICSASGLNLPIVEQEV
jgi:hypothetical protein